MNGGQIIARTLKEFGIRHLYTLSGGHIAPIYVEAENVGLEIIDVRDEATAVFAADATGRLSGTPGVAVVTAGPGVSNTITALKNAQLAQSPLLLIGGATATLLKGRGALQDIDQISMVRPHVKYCKRIKRLKDLSGSVSKALKISLSDVPGPVFLECPVDLLYDRALVEKMYNENKGSSKNFSTKLINWYIDRHVRRLFSGNIMTASFTDPNEHIIKISIISRVVKYLQSASKPLIIMGSGGLLDPKKAGILADSITQLNIPCYLSGMARGLLGPSSALQKFHKRRLALKESDCIILVGVPLDFRLNYGRVFNRTAVTIAVNRNEDDLHKNRRPTLSIHTDPGHFMISLAAHYQNPSIAPWSDLLSSRDHQRESEIRDMSMATVTGINPIRLLKGLNSSLPVNSVIIVDGGDFAASAAYTLRPRGPLKWLDPGVFGTLGVGGGFALAAAKEYPDHYVWIIYGDGSAAYSLAEFDTFKKFGMKVCAIIGNNGSWEQIAREQIPILGKDTASQLPQSDYHLIARAFGAQGERVAKMEDFTVAVKNAKKAMDQDCPYLINAIIGSTPFRKGSISM